MSSAEADSKARKAVSFDSETGVPQQVGPFSHAVQWGDLLFVTGQMPTDPQTGMVVEGGLIEQTRQVLRNLTKVVEQFEATLNDALMVRVYLEDFSRFDDFNVEYTKWFTGSLPSRTCIGSNGLAVGSEVEIDLIVGLKQP